MTPLPEQLQRLDDIRRRIDDLGRYL